MIKDLLQNYIKDYKITLTENQYEQFQKYCLQSGTKK